MPLIRELRRDYHRQLCSEIIRFRGEGTTRAPNFADSGSVTSRAIANKIVEAMGCTPLSGSISGQKAGRLFETVTKSFLEQAFGQLDHLRPGRWRYSTSQSIAEFDQYVHLADLEQIIESSNELRAALGGDYIIQPDIVISRDPVTDEEINHENLTIVDLADDYAISSPLRASNYQPSRPLLHASISCKWTVRSDRAQNTRTEALDNEDQMDMLETLIAGRRLRDISDLPFDLAI